MNDGKIDDFIHFLDFYKLKKTLEYMDLVNIIQMTNFDYIENKYYTEAYSGKTYNNESYYTMNESSHWN